METKKDWRRDNLATRIDLRMPNAVYDRVVELAIAGGEKINPKTNQVRVTSTLNKLIEIGIRHLSDENTSDNNPILSAINPVVNPIDIRLIERIRELEDKYQELSDKNISDNNPVDIGLTAVDIETAIDPINQSIEYLRSKFAEVSEFARNLQGEIVKVKKPLAVV